MPDSSLTTTDLLEELRWRGLIHQCTDEDGLAKLLASGPQTVYIGFDPTASSLHVGSLMQLMMLRRFQQAGHHPIALVGGATGMIGDPSGKSEERNLLSADQLQENVDGVATQMRSTLDFEGKNAAKLLNNFDWMKGYSYLEFLRDVGKNFPVGAMMGKESVRSRLESEVGLSYTEFSYMLLQAYDFVYLAKNHGCRIQAGGSDQWGNVTAGIDLGRRMLGQQLFGVTAPLLTTSDGKKMGKTEKGAIWLDPNRTSPYEFYQYWRNVDDADVMRCIAYLTEIKRDEYDSLAEATANDPGKRTAQNRLAEWMTSFIHGDAGLKAATSASDILFGGEIGDATDAMLDGIFADVPSSEVARGVLDGDGYWIVEALQATGLVKSGGEARRAIKEGGVYLNNTRVEDEKMRLTTKDLASETVMVFRRGKRKYSLLKFVE
ncbi:Tyrosine--tRNA ligase [Rubripirellula amarantea]|uniref:Tyrosine--tRNA ligase n=1 Tax=Rubripirellula amarantea TaxID=2527999 RepID=A0A5C5WWE4_9BACT|nr:tyrosine--tRNA ligase [Rubripirellula amarantea]TWT54182.1 Tyrosine--tRNA ligase [Rubripirellula amarantea]